MKQKKYKEDFFLKIFPNFNDEIMKTKRNIKNKIK